MSKTINNQLVRAKAYSYIRFSSKKQEESSSFQRQIEASERYARKHCLEIDQSLCMYDLGVSAYSEENLEEGNLGLFLDLIGDGKIVPGSYLLIENIDRLSRAKPSRALTLFMDIINAGIKLVTLSDEQVFEESNLDERNLYRVVGEITRAHNESKRKSELIQKSWDFKKDNIHKKKLTKWSPKWLRLSEDRCSFEVHEERKKIVEMIFEWSIAGCGASQIVNKLTEMGVPPWNQGDDIDTSKKNPKRWYTSYIHRLLQNKAVLGEFRYKKNGEEIVVNDYFPQIISTDIYRESIEKREVRRKSNTRGTVLGGFNNLFKGLLYCGYSRKFGYSNFKCMATDEVIVRQNKGNYVYLNCSLKKNGHKGCAHVRAWRYDRFEYAFLASINGLDISQFFSSRSAEQKQAYQQERKLSETKEKIELINGKIKKLTTAIGGYEEIPKFIIEEGIKLEKELETLKSIMDEHEKELAKLKRSITNLSQRKMEMQKLARKLHANPNDSDLRLRFNSLLLNEIDSVEVYSSGLVFDYDQFPDDLPYIKQRVERVKMHNEKERPFFLVRYKNGKTLRVIQSKRSDEIEFAIEIDEIGARTVEKFHI